MAPSRSGPWPGHPASIRDIDTVSTAPRGDSAMTMLVSFCKDWRGPDPRWRDTTSADLGKGNNTGVQPLLRDGRGGQRPDPWPPQPPQPLCPSHPTSACLVHASALSHAPLQSSGQPGQIAQSPVQSGQAVQSPAQPSGPQVGVVHATACSPGLGVPAAGPVLWAYPAQAAHRANTAATTNNPLLLMLDLLSTIVSLGVPRTALGE